MSLIKWNALIYISVDLTFSLACLNPNEKFLNNTVILFLGGKKYNACLWAKSNTAETTALLFEWKNFTGLKTLNRLILLSQNISF